MYGKSFECQNDNRLLFEIIPYFSLWIIIGSASDKKLCETTLETTYMSELIFAGIGEPIKLESSS